MSIFRLFLSVVLVVFFMVVDALAISLDPPSDKATTQEWVQYMNEFINVFSRNLVNVQRTSQRSKIEPSLQVSVQVIENTDLPIYLKSNDGKSLQIQMSESFMKSLGIYYLRTFLKLNAGLMSTLSPLSNTDIYVTAFNVNQGDKAAQPLLTDLQIKIFEAGETVYQEAPFLRDWLEFKKSLQRKLQEDISQANVKYEKEFKNYQKRIREHHGNDDDYIREQLWRMLNSSDREGLANFFKTYLPWEMMLTSDKIIWNMYIENITDAKIENKVMIYRGEPAYFSESPPKSIDHKSRNLYYKSSEKLRLAWPLRKFMAGELKFSDLVGIPSPGDLTKFKNDYGNTSFLHNLHSRRRNHSYGMANRRTTESPYISLSAISSHTRRFAMEGTSNGYVRAYVVSAERLNSAQKAFLSENEVLAPLFLLPDEEVAKRSASWNTTQNDKEFVMLNEKLIAEGQMSEKRRYFSDDQAVDPIKWLGSAKVEFCSKFYSQKN